MSSDLMMLSKEAPIIVNRGTKRRRQGLLLQGGAPVKKKYEPAYQLNSTKATTASPTNIIDDLNLSPLDHGSHDIGDNAPSGLTHLTSSLDFRGLRETISPDVDSMLFFNDGIQVGEDGIPLQSSDTISHNNESKVDASYTCSNSGRSSTDQISPFERGLQEAFAHYHDTF